MASAIRKLYDHVVRITSTGAGKAVKDLTEVKEASNRLAGSATSAGRAFAAQSAGLGGLVGAYAAAAATTFALQQGFDKLAQSARALQTFEGLKSLATATGSDATQLLKSVRDITNSQLTLAEAASQINLSLSAGFDTRQIEGLSSVAIKASRALGRDLTDAYTRIVRGSAKMETELLDELGIYTKIEPATRAYAASIGKTASQLSEYERRQAFANAVIAEGERKFAGINVTVPTTAEKIEAFGVTVIDVATKIGGFIANSLAPLAEFLTNNVAASFGAIGIAASLVASKGITLLEHGIDSIAEKAELMAARVSASITNLSKASAEAQEAARVSIQGFKVSGGGFQGSAANITKLKDLSAIAASNKLSNEELRLAKSILEARIAQLSAADSIIAKHTATKAALEAELTTLNAITKKTQEQLTLAEKTEKKLAQTNKNLENNNNALADSEKTLLLINTALEKPQARLGNFVGKTVLAMGALATSAATVASNMISIAANSVFYLSVLSLIGSTFAGLIGKQEEYNQLLVNAANSIKNFFVPRNFTSGMNTILSLTAKELTNLEKINAQLAKTETFTLTDTFIFGIKVDIEKTKEDLVREVSDALNKATNEKTFGESLTSSLAGGFALAFGTAITVGLGTIGSLLGPLGTTAGIALGGAIATAAGAVVGAAVDNALNKFDRLNPDEEAEVAGLTGESLATIQLQNDAVSKGAKILLDQYGTAAKLSFEGREYLKTQLRLLAVTGQQASQLRALTIISEQLGVSASELSSSFDISAINNIFSSITSKIAPIPISFVIVDEPAILAKVDSLFAAAAQQSRINTEKIQAVFIESSVDSVNDPIDAQIASLQAQIDSFDVGFWDNIIGRVPASTIASIAVLENKIEDLRKQKAINIDNIVESLPEATQETSNKLGDLKNKFLEAASASATLGSTGVLALTTLNNFNEAAQSANFDLEIYAQKLGAVDQAIESTSEKVGAAKSRLQELSSAFATFKSDPLKDLTGVDLQALQAQINSLRLVTFLGEVSLFLLEKQRAAAIAAVQPFKELLELSKQLSDQFGDLTLESDLVTKLGGVKNLWPDGREKDLSTLESIKTIYQQNATALQLQQQYNKDIYAINQANLLTQAEMNSLLVSTSANQKELQPILDKVFTSIGRTVQLLSSTEIAGADVATKSYNILINKAEEYLQTVYKIIAAYDELDNQIETQIANVFNQEKIAIIQFKIDKAQLLAQIDEARSQATIDQTQTKAESVRAQESAGTINSLQAAILIAQINQEVIDAQRGLIQEQAINQAGQTRLQKQLLNEQLAQDIAAAGLTANAQIQKLESDRVFLTQLLELYSQNLVGTAQVLDAFNLNFAATLNDFGTRFNSAMADVATNLADSIIKAYNVANPNSTITSSGAIPNTYQAFPPPPAASSDASGAVIAALRSAAQEALAKSTDLINKVGILKNVEIQAATERYARALEILDLQNQASIKERNNALANLDAQEAITSLEDLGAIANEVLTKSSELVIDYINTIAEAGRTMADTNSRLAISIMDLGREAANLEFEKQKLGVQSKINQITESSALAETKADAKQITEVEAAETVAANNQLLIAAQKQMLDIELAQEQASIDARIQILNAETEINNAAIQAEADLLISKINADAANLNSLVQILNGSNTAQYQTLSNFNTALAGTLKSFGDSFAAALGAAASAISAASVSAQNAVISAGNSAAAAAGSTAPPQALVVGGGATTISFGSVTPGDFAAPEAIAAVETAANVAVELAKTATAAVQESANAQIDANQEITALSIQNLQTEQEIAGLRTEEQKRQLDAEGVRQGIEDDARIADAKKGKGGKGGGGKDKTDELKKDYEKAVDYINDFIKKQSEALRQVATFFIKLVTDVGIASRQATVEIAKAGEEQASAGLEFVSERLEDAQSRLSEALSEEASIKEDLVELTEKMTKSQREYTEAFGSDDLVSKSKEYVDNIIEQSRKTIELNKTLKARSAIEDEIAGLEDSKARQENVISSAIRERIAAEENLAAYQELSANLLDLVSGKMSQFNDQLISLLTVLSGAGATGIGGVAQSAKQALFGNNAQGLGALKEQLGELVKATQTVAKTPQAIKDLSLKTEPAAGSIGKLDNITFGSKALASIQGAFAGAGIGSMIGGLTGDTGLGSTIGGAIGGALAPVVVNALSLAAGSFLAAAIPIVGPIIGALVGGLFSPEKNLPRGYSYGAVEGGEYISRGTDTAGDVSESTVRSLGNIQSAVFENILSALDSFGIEFKDTITSYLRLTQDETTKAKLQFGSGALVGIESADNSGTAAAEAITEAFFKGLSVKRNDEGVVTFRALVIDALTPNADDIQDALDRFAELKDIEEKTQDRFNESIKFASSFNDTISSLLSNSLSLGNVFKVIGDAAKAGASNALQAFMEFKETTIEVFGEGTPQIAEAARAIKISALSFLGLKETLTGFADIGDLEQSVNAGRVAIRQLVASTLEYERVLIGIGFSAEKASEAISSSLGVQLGNLIGDTNESVNKVLSIAKDNAQASVFELDTLVENSTSRIREARGLKNQLIKENSDIEGGLNSFDNLLGLAKNTILKLEQLGRVQIRDFISSLSLDQAEAILASDKFSDAMIKQAAASRIAELQEIDRTEALKEFVSLSKDFISALEDISGTILAGKFKTSPAALIDFIQALGDESSSGLSDALYKVSSNIASGVDIVDNFEKGIGKLQRAYDKGAISGTEYVDALRVLQDVTIETIQSTKELIDAYDDTLSQLKSAVESSIDDVTSSIADLRDGLITLVEGIQTSTSTIFDIYDATLTDLASSGNAIYDLRDTAKEAFESSTKALKQFELANSLSGRSASSLREEIDSIQGELNSILSDGIVSFAEFATFSSLTTEQNALKRELNTLLDLQDEYNALLEDQSTATDDLAYVESAIIALGQDLIDTRRNESDIIKQTQDAIDSFTKAQTDLRDITEILAKNNFDLNRARFDEVDRVSQLNEAILKLNADSTELSALVGDLLSENSNILEDLKKSARELADQLNPNDTQAADETAKKLIKSIKDNFVNGIIPMAEAIDKFLDPAKYMGEAVENSSDIIVESVGILSDRFKEFNTDLVKYLYTDGLKPFYGPSGYFKSFADSLYSTVVLDGFERLTISGGPMENFNTLVSIVRDSLNKLVAVDSYRDINVTGFYSNSVVYTKAIGETADELSSAAQTLALIGVQDLSNIPTALKDVAGITTSLNTINSLSIDFKVDDELTNLYNTLLIVDSDIGKLDLSVNADKVSGVISTAVYVIDSSIKSLNIANKANTVSGVINTAVTVIDSSIGSLNIANKANTVSGVINTAVTVIDSSIKSLNIANKANTVSGVISTAVTVIDSSIGSLNIVNKANTVSSVISTAVTVIDSSIGSLNIANKATTVSGIISTAVSVIDSSIGSLNIYNKATTVSGVIKASVSLIDGSIGSLDIFNKATTVSGVIKASVGLIDSSIKSADIFNKATTVSGVISTSIGLIDSSIKSADILNKATTVSGVISTAVELIDSSIKPLNIASKATTVSGVITTAVTLVNSSIKSLGISDKATTVSGKISSAISAVKSSIDSLEIVTTANDVTASLTGSIDAIEAAIGAQISGENSDIALFLKGVSINGQAIKDFKSNIKANISNIEEANSISYIVANTTIADKAIKGFGDNFRAYIDWAGWLISTSGIKNEYITGFRDTFRAGINLAGDIIKFSALSDDKIKEFKKNIKNNMTDVSNHVGGLSISSGVKSLTDHLTNYLTNKKESASLTSFLSSINISQGVIDFKASLAGITSTATTAFQGLIDIFTTKNTNLVNTFTTSLSTLAAVLTTVNKADVKVLGKKDSVASVQALADNLTILKTEIDKLTDKKGVESLNAALKGIVTDLAAAWDAVKLAVPSTITVSATATLPTSSTEQLDTIAENTGKFPALNVDGISYTTQPLASGGYVSGPGSATSDSIPARLSNGEYVLNARAVKNIGKAALDSVNTSGDLMSGLGALGRRGDDLIAHINRREAVMLKQAGGAGTINSMTGLLEFYNKGGTDLIGKTFVVAETNKLFNAYKGSLTNQLGNQAPSAVRGVSAVKNAAGINISDVPFSYNDPAWVNLTSFRNFLSMLGVLPTPTPVDANTFKGMARSTGNTLDMATKILASRGLAGPGSADNRLGGANFPWYNLAALGGKTLEADMVGKAAPISTKGGFAARPLQMLANYVSSTLASTMTSNLDKAFNKQTLRNILDAVNETKGIATDFYMLKNVEPTGFNIPTMSPPSSVASMLLNDDDSDRKAGGGLVTRDRVSTMLEPGEFVIRKPIVDQLGIDAMTRLNATGSMNGDVNVAVNVINNGQPVEVRSIAKTRAENGNVIVDVVIEDLRNNGPIKQALRSIR